ncbi:MAG: MMPL family transporter [Clostridiales bacterium]|nr:MMPL family transporter [Clostridiales bacterium]
MSENKNGGNFMMKIAEFIVDKRNLVFLIFAILIIFSAFSRNWVEVENDLIFYLPEDAETKIGLDLMDDEFVTFGTAKIMVSNISYPDAESLAEELGELECVQSLAFDDTDSHYNNASALFDVTFDYSEKDEKCVESLDKLKELLADYDIFVSSAVGEDQSATIAAEMQVIIVIVAIVVVSVLFLTSQTYAEVPVLIMTFLSAAIINMGSNFLLGKISFISNSVTIVLQLALSVDYAIILCNRYKEEHEVLPIRESAIIALSKAIPEIFSSSLTTVGGLIAMMFMQFKIGGDMGICLIKSIVFSLLSVFVLMPGLLVLFGELMDRSKHKSFVPKIPWVGKFAHASRFVVPPLFVALIIGAFLFQKQCPYTYGDGGIETPIKNETQIAEEMIADNFTSTNLVAVVVPTGNTEAEKKLLDELDSYDEVHSTLGLANVEAMDGYMLTDKLTPRQFSELADLDYEVAELLYAAYAVDGDNYGKIVSGLSGWGVPLIDIFMFLHDEIEEGYVTLDAELQEKIDDAYIQMNSAKKQLRGEKYDRMLVYLNLPEGGDETYEFLDTIHALAEKYYPDDIDDIYVVGNSTNEYDFKKSFEQDNLVVNILSILIVLVVLLGTFKSVGMPILLILVIQGSIWINFAVPAISDSPLFFLSSLIVSSIQMGANIDYAIVISSRFMELKDEMSKKEAIIETMNMSFPTIITSGSMMAVAGVLIGQMTSNTAIVGIGQCLGRGTIVSLIIVMFVLPQILLLGEKVIDKTSFSVKRPIRRHTASGKVRVDGMVRGEINGTVNGIIHAVVDGDVNVNVISGNVGESNEE